MADTATKKVDELNKLTIDSQGEPKDALDESADGLVQAIRDEISEMIQKHEEASGPSEDIEMTSYTIGREAAFQTIQKAYDSAMADNSIEGVHLAVSDSYNAQDENYPIQFHGRGSGENRTWVPLRLSGQGPGITQIGVPGVRENTIEVHGPWTGPAGAYKKPIVLEYFTLKGAKMEGDEDHSGIRIASVPFGRIHDVTCDTDGHAVSWLGEWLDTEHEAHCFGWAVNDTKVWGGERGFDIRGDAGAHGTEFANCHTTACRSTGVRIIGAANVTYRGGVIQLCYGWGAEIRGAKSTTIREVYVEGNARGNSYPVEIYTRGDTKTIFDGCYFHGINPRSTSHEHQYVMRAVNSHTAVGLTFTNNQVRRYGDGAVAQMHKSEAEVHNNTIGKDANEFGLVTDSCTITKWGQEIEV